MIGKVRISGLDVTMFVSQKRREYDYKKKKKISPHPPAPRWPPNPSLSPSAPHRKGGPESPSKSQLHFLAPTPPPSPQEGGEGFITHLFLPVAMETKPSPFIPSGTGNISPTQAEWRGLSPNTPVTVLGEGAVVKNSAPGAGASGPDDSGGTRPRDKG